MDQDHPTEGWLVKTGAEIKIQQDPAVMVQGWPSAPDSPQQLCHGIPPTTASRNHALGSFSTKNLYKAFVGTAVRWHCWREDTY